MKTVTTIIKQKLILPALAIGIGFSAFAGGKKEEPVISIASKDKVAIEPGKRVIPFMALKFRSGSVAFYAEGKGKDVTKERAFAVLDGIDDKLCQQITDEFLESFKAKMKAAGFEYLSYDAFKSNEIYQKFIVDTLERHFNHRNYGTADAYTPGNVPMFSYPTIPSKQMKFAKETGASLVCLKLTVDFAEFDMDIATTYGYNTGTVTNFSAKILPGIKITSTFQEGTFSQAFAGSYFNSPGMSITNEKGQAALFMQNKNVFVPFNNPQVKAYSDKEPEFSKRSFRFFGGAMQLGTWVVKPTPEDYKRAALEALNKYTDEIITAMKAVK